MSCVENGLTGRLKHRVLLDRKGVFRYGINAGVMPIVTSLSNPCITVKSLPCRSLEVFPIHVYVPYFPM